MSSVEGMKVACVGAGYVGGSTMAMMALKCPGIKVTCIDINEARVAAWNSDELPIHEPGLLPIVQEVRGKSLFFVGKDKFDETIIEADLIFVCVNTPTKKHGVGAGRAADLSYWEMAARGIAEPLKSADPTKLRVVVEKSTVPVHTADAVASVLESAGVSNAEVLSNPEFLAEGTAIRDLTAPDRVLIGGQQTDRGFAAIETLAKVYRCWVPEERVKTTNVWSAELAKLIANGMLAQRVSSINTVAQICEATGADVGEVSMIVGMDSRIGSKFLQPSVGFGGSCFQKDILSLIYICQSKGLTEVAEYWHQVIKINDLQRKRFSNTVISSMYNTVARKKICMFGFAFKKDTGDTRETASIYVGRDLLEERAQLSIYDPQVSKEQMMEDLKDCVTSSIKENPPNVDELVTYETDPYAAAAGAHAIIICTEWDEFKAYDYNRIYESMLRPAFLFDGRRILDKQTMEGIGFRTYIIGHA
jgi:UDPglucose 6-dehydrogenase